MPALSQRRLLPCLIALALASPFACAERPDGAVDLDPVEVTAAYPSEAVQRERNQLDRVPGGTNLIQPQQLTRLATLRDALDYQPGIVVQDFFGGLDQPRLNIRGSGIQSNPVNRGVLLLRDGLPLNEADGSFVIGLLEPRNAAAISVRRGANASTPGATTLGGELDLRSLTAADEQYRFGLDFGSFGRYAAQGGLGAAGDRADAHIGASADRWDGYRHHSDGRRRSVQANVGFSFGDGAENRSYLDWTDLLFHIPTVVPKARVESDPQGVLGDGDTPLDRLLNIYQRNPLRDTQQLRLANITQWGSADLGQRFGLYWQNTDDTFKDPTEHAVTDSHTAGVQWQLEGRAAALDYRVALATARSDMDRSYYANNPQNGTRLQRFGDFAMRARNNDALAGLDWHFAPAWTLQAEVKWSDATRDVRDLLAGAALDQGWTFATPKIGAIWNLGPGQRLYANLSRSHEAPTFWEIVTTSVAPQNPANASTELVELDVQRATTYEVGTEGEHNWDDAGRLHWSVSVYRSEVDDELISSTDPYGISVGTYNYVGGTRHQGIEAGIDGSQPLAGVHALEYRVAWTYSDFRFEHGEFAGNRIAGVPRHLLSAELLYRAGAWRLGPNLRWMPDATPTDHANTPGMQQDAYALLGARIEYATESWRAWALGENLTDRRYASSYAIRNQAGPSQPTFLPGDGRSFSVGFTWRY